MSSPKYQMLFVAKGDDPNDPEAWKPIDVSSIEFQIDDDPAEIATTHILKHHYERTFTVHKIGRQALKLITGRLTLPGDGPLIRNGGKP